MVWKRLYLRPFAARRSAVGVLIGPPKALEAPKPTSSIRTIRTLGDPSGGRSGSIGGKDVPGSFASYVVCPAGVMSGTGRTSRFRCGFSGTGASWLRLAPKPSRLATGLSSPKGDESSWPHSSARDDARALLQRRIIGRKRPMLLLLALLLLIFVPAPWNVIGALATGALGVFEVVYWQRRMRGEKIQTGVENLVGKTGVAAERLAPSGHVRVLGEIWEARLELGGSSRRTRAGGRSERPHTGGRERGGSAH